MAVRFVCATFGRAVNQNCALKSNINVAINLGYTRRIYRISIFAGSIEYVQKSKRNDTECRQATRNDSPGIFTLFA